MGLAPETFQSLRVVGDFVGQELEGDEATELECPRPCTPHPCRRRRASRRCGSARWFGRSWLAQELRAAMLGVLLRRSQRKETHCSFAYSALASFRHLSKSVKLFFRFFRSPPRSVH